jgi:hypothetical protein
MSEDLLLPDFLGIGAVKAGTTWLHRNLYEHAELYLPVQKPLYFWDRHRARGLEGYARILSPGRDRLRGEFTASYSVLPSETKSEMRDLMPDLKLILVLREPRDRAWSEAKMELTLIQERDAQTLDEDDYMRFIRSEKCRERGDYAAILRSWTDAFPREQIHVGLYDDIRDHPRRFLGQVFDFLGVATPDDWSSYPFTERIFKGPEIDIPDRCRELLEETYHKAEIEEVARLSGLDLVKAWGYE